MLEMVQVIVDFDLVFISIGVSELILDKVKLEVILDFLIFLMLVDIFVFCNIVNDVSKLLNVICFNVDDLKVVVV